MSPFAPELEISFTYDMDVNLFGNVKTNIKPGYIGEILDNWMCTQRGVGEENSKALRRDSYHDGSRDSYRDSYHIKIRLDLKNDCFSTESDTGNKSLTAGIVIEFSKFLSNLSDLEKQTFLN